MKIYTVFHLMNQINLILILPIPIPILILIKIYIPNEGKILILMKSIIILLILKNIKKYI